MAKAVATRWFIFPDIHGKDRDNRALAVAMAAQRMFKPHHTIILGDMLNCSPFSGHRKKTTKEAKAMNWKKEELDPMCKFLDEVQKHTLDTTHFVEGNHEAWIERFLANLGSLGVSIADIVNLQSWLSANRKQFAYYPYGKQTGDRRSRVKLHRDLYAVHGWTACKHAAEKHLELSRSRSILHGHTHRIQTAYGRDPWTGTPIVAHSLGCLCKLQPMYLTDGHPTQWNHGFGLAHVGKRSFTTYPIPILKTFAVLPDGTEAKA